MSDSNQINVFSLIKSASSYARRAFIPNPYFHCYIHDYYFFKFSCPTFSTIWQSDPFTGSNTCSKLPVNGITASRTDSINLPSHAIDQNVKTRWSNLGLGSWIQIDVGHENVICDVGINWHRGNERVNTFVISISKDGNAFTNAFSG